MKFNKIMMTALLVASAAGFALATTWNGTAYVGYKSSHVINGALVHVAYTNYASIGGTAINSIGITNLSCGSGGTATKTLTDYPGLMQSIQELDRAMTNGIKLIYIDSQTISGAPTAFCAFPTSGWFSLAIKK